jgi:GH15 family glucan-1,4-alpha-glucosidase
MDPRYGQAQYHPLSDYGVIGDCHTVALVAADGSIDWYCPGRFDAPAVFCRLLDSGRGGYLRVAPGEKFDTVQSYQGETNILETTFESRDGSVLLTDFMPLHRRTPTRRGYDVGTSQTIIRVIEGLSGRVELSVDFYPTFDYARARTSYEQISSFAMLAGGGGGFLSLSCSSALDFHSTADGGMKARLAVEAGKRYWLVLSGAHNREQLAEAPDPDHCRRQLEDTREYWQSWSSECTYNGPYRREVVRSSLVLKLLTYEPTGAVVAAPTTSLPEQLGGERNWDYRYTWLRDASLILYALTSVGYEHEAADFFEWLQETHQKDPSSSLQVLYGIDGGREMKETVLDHLAGYRHSRPVRIGNAAAGQLQLDIYGEILTAAHLYFKSGMGERTGAENQSKQRLLHEDWPLLTALVNRSAERWEQPDNGIWEVRGGRRQTLYSKIMCWAAVDRGMRLAREYSLEAPLERWSRSRERIKTAILTRGYNRSVGAFVQNLDGSELDASALAIPRVGLLPPTDERIQSTIARISTELSSNGLLYRYRSADGLQGSEVTFALCTFWLVDCLALGGRLEEARELFDRVLSYGSPLGLFSEEIDPVSGELLGNFPQGFTHMALINSAVNLAKAARHGAEKEPETEFERAARGRSAASDSTPAGACPGDASPRSWEPPGAARPSSVWSS